METTMFWSSRKSALKFLKNARIRCDEELLQIVDRHGKDSERKQKLKMLLISLFVTTVLAIPEDHLFGKMPYDESLFEAFLFIVIGCLLLIMILMSIWHFISLFGGKDVFERQAERHRPPPAPEAETEDEPR